MFLKSIKITNFRNIGEKGIQLEFNKGVNAIIGENNQGKSAVIDAIRLAFNSLSYQKQLYFNKSDFHVNLKNEIASYAQFDIFLEEVPRELHEIIDPLGSGGEFHVKFMLKINSKGVEKIKPSIWGGKVEESQLSAETLEAIEIAYLGALRNAEAEMRPSKYSKLANLLNSTASSESQKNELVELLKVANASILEKDSISRIKGIINTNLSAVEQEILGQHIDIGLVEPTFQSIASSLRTWVKSKWIFLSNTEPNYTEITEALKTAHLFHYCNEDTNGCFIHCLPLSNVIETSSIPQDIKQKLSLLFERNFELNQNGLGYNNLLFMSTVLGDMSIKKDEIIHNIFLIEEPEAHLHPQLQELVHNFFTEQCKNSEEVQVIYTSHSPTLVSKIDLDNINLLYSVKHHVISLPLSQTDLDEHDKIYLKKYLDTTKSQMFFAKGIVFVEGISEALLLPEIANYLDKSFVKHAVEVVNVDSLAFKPFIHLIHDIQKKQPAIKAVVISDDDRCTKKADTSTYISKDFDYDDDITQIQNKINTGSPSERYEELKQICNDKGINFCGAKKTLEYELAFCEANIVILLEIIKQTFPQVGLKLEATVNSLVTTDEKQICIWLFIKNREKSKGEIALALCEHLRKQDFMNPKPDDFEIPPYLKDAIEKVTDYLDI